MYQNPPCFSNVAVLRKRRDSSQKLKRMVAQRRFSTTRSEDRVVNANQPGLGCGMGQTARGLDPGVELDNVPPAGKTVWRRLENLASAKTLES